MHGGQHKGPQTDCMSKNKRAVEANTSEQPIVSPYFIGLLNRHPARLYGADGPKEGLCEAQCWPMPPEKEVVEKKASSCKILRMNV